ncbi:MAG: YgiT-type zinc finger protein [Candidatus Hadarchaeota archaeon]|nr:YgiT-type zinc finger protein [Candidatus Hadarchaeota archaeon]
MGPDLHKEEREMRAYPCRCGGKTRLKYKEERTSGTLIKNVPVLVCTRCGEEWYPPGVPTMIEGIWEAAKNVDKVEVSAERTKASAQEG